jgi:hypothetical protein
MTADLIIFSPHLDDAVLSLGGMIGREGRRRPPCRSGVVLHGWATDRFDRTRAARVWRLHDAPR